MTQPEQARVELWRLISGFQISQAIHVAAALGIADLLKEGSRSSDDLARQTKSDPDALYRLLRALASVQVFEERPDKEFALTPLSEYLRRDSPQSAAAWATLSGRTTSGTRGDISTRASRPERTCSPSCTE